MPSNSQTMAVCPFRGLMHGWLDGRSTLMRLPYSNKFSKLYPVNFTDPVREGDCGSLVIDQNTKQIYGFIVAASMEGRVAYVVSADEILQDITSKLGQECAGGHSISKEPSVPLHATSDKGSQAAINLLPGRTADVSSKDATVGATPLLWAAINGHAIVVKLLLENGAVIESKDTVYGRTPISWAAMNGHTAIVRLLLGMGADIEAKDQPFSPTPLSLAAMNGHAAIVKMLLEAKADTESVAAYPVESSMQCDPPNPALTEDTSHPWQPPQAFHTPDDQQPDTAPPIELPDLEWTEDAYFSPALLGDSFVEEHATNNDETMNSGSFLRGYPPLNSPAKKTPPCNTLYVGDLPIETSEEELKAIFSKQPGYKRMCFRTKQSKPMCFVEFEDIAFATEALQVLDGHQLQNSVEGRLNLRFSMNPLGVRLRPYLAPFASPGRQENEYESSRDHDLYKKAAPHGDGLYHCPWEGLPSCNHKPEKLKCNYDKFIDSHLKPYRCEVESCEGARFSSTACLLRHVREAHGLHGHGEKPFLCTFDGCERALPGNGFPRQWNLRDHMKRVHNDHGSLLNSPTKSNRGRKCSLFPRVERVDNLGFEEELWASWPLLDSTQSPQLSSGSELGTDATTATQISGLASPPWEL